MEKRRYQGEVHRAREEKGSGGRLHAAEEVELLLRAGNIVNAALDGHEGTAVGPSLSGLRLHSFLLVTYHSCYPSRFHYY